MAAAAAALVLVGCSSDPPEYRPPAGELAAGTAEVTVNGRDAGVIESVTCDTTGPLSTITTDENGSSLTAMVSNETDLSTQFVRIRDLGGFTGSYNVGIQGEADVTMTGLTYDISGTAYGYDTDAPSFRAPATFAIKVSC
ncbi:lipoprotein LpqH [Mycobacterium sp. IDR2000157661]|nr:lipoprotein LpqH [Mycobacterium sp. IDR2000157661]